MREKLIGLICAGALLVGCKSDHKHPTTAKAEADVCETHGDGVTAQATPAKPAAPAAEAQKASATFGGEPKLTAADTIPLATVLANPDEYKGKLVRVTGQVSDVCAKKGCWLRVVPTGGATTTGDVFIKFKDPPAGRLIPMEAIGHDVTVEGTLKVGMMSEQMARHFKEDAGASEEEINKIVGPQKQVAVSGAVVSIEGVEKPAAE